MPVKQKTETIAAVQQFRAEADRLLAEIADPGVTLTQAELKTKQDAIAVLEGRAAAAAGFTSRREIEAQGGDVHPGVTRVDAAGVLGRRQDNELDDGKEDPYAIEHVNTEDVIKEMGARAQKYFGGVREFYRACMPEMRGTLNPKQRQVIEDCEAMARYMFPEEGKGGRSVTIEGRTITGSTNVPAANVLLPLQQVPAIFAVPNTLMGILQGAARYTVSGRTLRIPYVVQTNAGVTRPLAGIANVSIIAEGQTKNPLEPTYLQRTLTVQKWAAIAQIADETLGDDFTGQLAPNVTNQVGGQVINSMNEFMTFSGNDAAGTTQPLGALNAVNPSLLVWNRANHAKIQTSDVFHMFERHTHGPKSMWLVSRRTLSQIFALTLAGTTLVTFIQSLNAVPGAPQAGMVGYLLGYPVYICDILPSLGNQSDFNLVNPEFYAAAIRTNLTVESSIHVAFTADVTTYRFLARGGGIPIPDGTYAYQSPSGTKIDEHSPFVALGQATGS